MKMNLRVNLILDKEIRSAAPVSIRMVLISLSILVAGIFIIVFGIKLFELAEAERQASQAETVLSDLSRRQSEEKEREKVLSEITAYGKEFDFWLSREHNWADKIYEIARLTPETVQIERFSLQKSTAEQNGKLARNARFTLNCRIEADPPEPVIRQFHNALASLSGDRESTPENFRPIVDASGVPTHYTFRINMRFRDPEGEE